MRGAGDVDGDVPIDEGYFAEDSAYCVEALLQRHGPGGAEDQGQANAGAQGRAQQADQQPQAPRLYADLQNGTCTQKICITRSPWNSITPLCFQIIK